jgi:hypothetical protein
MKYLQFESSVFDVGGRKMFYVSKVCLTATLSVKSELFMFAKIGQKALFPQILCHLASPLLLLTPTNEKRLQQCVYIQFYISSPHF